MRCSLCGKPIPEGIRPWQRVHGWERKARAETRKSGSDIAGRTLVPDEFACDVCVRRVQAGVSVHQETLL